MCRIIISIIIMSIQQSSRMSLWVLRPSYYMTKRRPKRTFIRPSMLVQKEKIVFWSIFQPIQQNIHHFLLSSQFCGTKMSAMCDEYVGLPLFTRLAQFCATKLTAMCDYSCYMLDILVISTKILMESIFWSHHHINHHDHRTIIQDVTSHSPSFHDKKSNSRECHPKRPCLHN